MAGLFLGYFFSNATFSKPLAFHFLAPTPNLTEIQGSLMNLVDVSLTGRFGSITSFLCHIG